MSRLPLYRHVRARGLLELFLVSGIVSLLSVRFYLHITGYPQIGGDTLHIAHMLWGGLLMLAAVVLSLAFLGYRSLWLAALVGGAGFGVFIDEIGKFITHDNDYFFRPAVGIIYVIFVGLYLIFYYLGQERKLSSREYQLNALLQLEEAVASDLDPAEKARVLELLDAADGRNAVTQGLRRLVDSLETVRTRSPDIFERLTLRLDGWYASLWKRRQTSVFIRWAFLAEAVLLLLGVLALAAQNIEDLLSVLSGSASYSLALLVGQIASATLAAVLAVRGAMVLPRERVRAFRYFRRATYVSLLLTQIFIFFREQFAAMPGFFLNLILLVIISYVLHQEGRLRLEREVRR